MSVAQPPANPPVAKARRSPLSRGPASWRDAVRLDPARGALVGLLLVGIGARVALSLSVQPALTYPDSGNYFESAVGGLWSDPLRTAGYPMLLDVLRAITPHLLLVVAVQHLMGLAAAVLLFAMLRRLGAPAGVALIPCAVVLLSGDELLIEHTALSETALTLLLTMALYCAVRARRSGWVWAIAAGACAGLSVWMRAAALPLVVIVPAWLLLCEWRLSPRTLATCAVSLIAGLATLATYTEWHYLGSGQGGLAAGDGWQAYGRVASFADCSKFTPPAGTQRLCEATPPRLRPLYQTPVYYQYDQSSPAVQLFGPPWMNPPQPGAQSALTRFAIAAVEGQPLDYLHAVWQDAVKLIDPSYPSHSNLTPSALMTALFTRPQPTDSIGYWELRAYPGDPLEHGSAGAFRWWEKLTRITGAPFVLLFVLCLLAPWSVRGQPRSETWLIVGTVLVLLLFPLFVHGYEYRYVIPLIGPFAAGAGLGGWGVAERLHERRSIGG